MLFGVSTHNAEEINHALAGNCSYLNIGPVFPTRTKSVACGDLGLAKAEELKSAFTDVNGAWKCCDLKGGTPRVACQQCVRVAAELVEKLQ